MHRVLEYNHSKWIKSYIEFNTQKRIEAKTKNRIGLRLVNKNTI